MELLAVGEGNFSFALSLAALLKDYKKRSKLPPQGVPFVLGTKKEDAVSPIAVSLVATSFDSSEDLLEKYPESVHILNRVSNFEANELSVQHGINAWELETQFPDRRFDAVIWNHPHLGVEDFRLHKFLMSHFFYSAACVLKGRREQQGTQVPGGESHTKAVEDEEREGHVCMSLVSGQFERWSVEPQAERHGFELVGRHPFIHSEFPLYESKRNHSGQSFQNVHTQKHHGHEMVSTTYVFRRRRLASSLRRAADPPGAQPWASERQSGNSVTDSADDCRATSAGQAASPRGEVFGCAECGLTFKTKQGAATHRRQVHQLKRYGESWKPEMPKTLTCSEPFCDRKFHDEEARKQHHISRHGADREIPHALSPLDSGPIDSAAFYGCPICTQAIPSGWGVQQHLEMLKPCLRLKAKCELCGKQFSELRAMRQHRNFCDSRSHAKEGGLS